MKYFTIVLCGVFLVFGAANSIVAEESGTRKAGELLADRAYAEAIPALQELLDAGTENRDYVCLLMGNALFYQQNYEQALAWYQKIVKEYPGSVWKQKAIFKQADCYVQLKQFDRAETIYAQEVIRLVSPERKEQIARVYLDFAEQYFSGEWVTRNSQQTGEKIPDYARAKTFYELALEMELGKEKEEEIRFQIARCAFELDDYAGAIDILQDLQKTYPEGKYFTEAVYYLGQSYLNLGQFIQARKVLRDFIEAYPDDPQAPEAAFLMSRTYNIPVPNSVDELELGVKALRDFVEIYHDNERVPQAEYEIGVSYFHFGRNEDAVAAFSAYIEKYEGREQPAETLPNSNADERFEGLPLVRYYLGLVYQRQQRFTEAIAVWKDYLQQHSSHYQWSEVQRQILETEYRIADRFFQEEQYQAARAAWEQFLADHPLDPRNPQIMYRIGETFVKEAHKLEDAVETTDVVSADRMSALPEQAIAQWKRTVSKYPGTEPASKAQFEIGRLLETRLLKFEEALEAYKLVTWGAYSAEAQQRIRAMQAKRLTVLTGRVFRTDETPTLNITARNIESLTLKVYKIDLETYFRKMQTTAGVDNLDIALIDPDDTWDVAVDEYEDYREFERDVPLPFTEPGAYLVTCSEQQVSEGAGYEATTLVLISDIDIIVKTTKRDLLVFAQNMNTGETFPAVDILVSDGSKIVFEGVTGDDGVLHEAVPELKDSQDVRVFAYTQTNYAATTLMIGDLRYVAGLESRGYIYTDRPAYRPGQQVNIRGILREVDEQGVLRIPQTLTPPFSQEEREDAPTSPFSLQVVSSQGNVVYQDQVPLNDFGSFTVDFALSSSAPAGEYRILVSKDKQTYSGSFLVELYKLEKIKLTIETEHDVYFRGETITGTIKAEYYYGEPVKAKPVSYTLAGIEVFSGVTDDNGEISFLLDTRNFAESQTLTLIARLDEENVQTGKTVWLATRGFSCEVSTIRNVYLVNEDIEVRFLTKDPAGNPLAKDLQFGLFKRERTPYGGVAEVSVMEKQQLTTAGDGTATALIQIEDGGQYVLRAEGVDRFGNPVSGQTELFISGDDDEIKLRLLTGREEFRVGERPEVTLFSRASEGLGLLTYEGESILSYQILHLQQQKNPLMLSIDSEHAPNFTLAVAQMDGNRFHQAQKEFSVVQGLNIAISPVEDGHHLQGGVHLPEYEPGETITVEISTTDHNGNPVPAEVSLAMVDEALYAQYAEMIPPIRDYFYDQRRGLLSRTETSCIFRFEAQTREIVEDLLEEEKRVTEEMQYLTTGKELVEADIPPLLEPSPPDIAALQPLDARQMAAAPEKEAYYAEVMADAESQVEGDVAGEFLAALREYFPETGYWNPSIVTDAAGKAVVTIQLPDSTTSWRFTSRGITKETLVGEATAGIVTKMPFFVDMKTPQVFTEGDRVRLLASVHNYSGEPQAVQLTFTGSMDTTVLERQEQQLASEDGSVLETAYQLDLSQTAKFDTLAPLVLELDATAEQAQDRIKREVPVRLWGIEYVTTKSGTLQDDRSIDISLPGDRNYLYREMSILLNPAVERTLVELTGDVPWQFKAPASSPVHEAMVVLNAIRFLSFPEEKEPALGAPASLPALKQLQARLASLLVDISLRQNQDGGWNWTGTENRSDLFVSADAVLLLAIAHRQGYIMPSDTLPRGIAYLKQAFQSAQENEIKTYLLYALAVAGDVDFAHVNRVYRERNTLTSAGLALLTLIYTEINRPEIAAELLVLLENRAKRVSDPATGKQTVYWPSESIYPWLQGDTDSTALALLAQQQVNPASSGIADVVAWLYTQRQWIGWGSMRTNARVSSALLEYFSNAKYAINRYILDVDVNGTPVQTLTVDSEQSLIVLQIPAELVKDYDNAISFRFDGRGSLNYVCALEGVSRDVRKTQEHFELWRYYEPAPLVFQGKEIPRGFSVLDGSYSTWRNKLTQIPLGGFGRVTVQYHRRIYESNQPYQNARLILEEPIPAGCTVLEQSIEGGFLDYEIRDGAIVFFLNNARYGTITYDLYGYLPGEYRVLPAKIQSAYQPEQRDYGEQYQMTVLGRGQAVTETYRKTPDELYYYGKALFEAKQYAEARELLQELFEQFRLRPDPYKDTAKMLMYIAIAEANSREIVHYFEILKEKYPDLVMAFEDIIKVGKAYRDIGEYERAVQVFKATAEASFLKDVQVSGALEGQGEFLASVEYTKNVLLEYPDIPTTETSFYALAQLLYTEAGRMEETGNRKLGTEELSAKDLLTQVTAMLHQFLVLYPENPIADEVSFSLANAYLDLEDFATAIQVVQRFQQRYPKSVYLSGYQYIEGYANFESEQYEEALRLCNTVATSTYPDKQGRMVESDHKYLAIYIMGQIYHSMGQPEQAIAEYEKVEDRFPDAKEAIVYFTRKRLALDEVTTFKPGEEARLTIRYRNVKEANILVYRVDLMKLYLLQKNLNNITNINLAGVSPYHQETLTLGEGKDYAEKEYSVVLPLEEEGAYLVVAKETELDASGMALVSVLRIEAEEDAVSGRVRVNVINAETGRYENNVHVKVIGSGDTRFISGETDLRGIFIADNIHGTATVIARKGDQYAFYRGKTALQPRPERPRSQVQADMRSQAMQHLRENNLAIQQQSEQFLRGNLYQNKQEGVEVQAAY